MAVKPEVQAFLDLLAQLAPPEPPEPRVSEVREQYRQLYAMVSGPEVAQVVEQTIPGSGGAIPVRVYTPDTGSAPRPVLVWFHGGGFVIGDLDTTDNTARSLASRAGIVVVSVGYRLAPEHPFPAAVDDAFEATQWVFEHADGIGADRSRLAVGGHSAGANLAAVTTQLAKSMGRPPVALQVLCCPAVDASTEHPSMTDNAEGYFLTRNMMSWFLDTYLAGHKAAVNNARVSPLLATDLSGLPPAIVVTAEHDPLRDEGDAYAAALQAAGVAVEHRCYQGEIHDFYTLEGILPEASDALAHLARSIEGALG